MQLSFDHEELKHVSKYRARTLVVPFLSEDLMEGPPDCSLASFITPRLRRARGSFSFSSIDWKRSERLDGGLDGHVWKVWFGDDGPYALKVYWDAEPMYEEMYWAPQREAQNAALFQMIETALERAEAESKPVLLSPNPPDHYTAVFNIDCFADELRRDQDLIEGDSGSNGGVRPTAMPRMAKCYGWLKVNGDDYVQAVPRKKKAPDMEIDKLHRCISYGFEYTAIVFEYLEDKPNDPKTVVEVDRFLYMAGFGYNRGFQRNWRDSVLVDHADYVHPRGYGWQKGYFKPREADEILEPNELVWLKEDKPGLKSVTSSFWVAGRSC